jgi:Flp pilus assembly protein TadD
VAVGAVLLAAVPTLSALAETDITEAQSAYAQGDCARVEDRADRARSLLPMLPEPHALLALCALRDDRPADAQRLARRAVATDPNDWEWRFLDALVIGTSGRDPRPELRVARRLNPRGVAPAAFARVLAETPRPLWSVRSVQAYVWMRGTAYSAIRQ